MDGQERSISTELANLFSDNLKFVLKRGVTLLFLELIHNLTKSGELTDNSDNHITRAVLNASTGENDGRGKLVRVLGGLASLEILEGILTEAHAHSQGLLTTLIRLTSHGSLIGHHLVAGDANTIDRHNITSLEVDNIADLDFFRVKLFGANLTIFVKACYIDLI